MVNLYAGHTAVAPGARSRRFTLADLPGYGFARGGETARREFDALTRSFFRRLVARIPNASAGPTRRGWRERYSSSTAGTRAWRAISPHWRGCSDLGPPIIVVTTKNDRQSGNVQRALRSRHERALERPILAVSSRTGVGVPAVRAALGGMLL